MCSRCPENHPACLEFHHNGIEKKLHCVSKIKWSLKKLKEEIAKCEVLCANCHKMEHWNEEELNYTKLHGTLA